MSTPISTVGILESLRRDDRRVQARRQQDRAEVLLSTIAFYCSDPSRRAVGDKHETGVAGNGCAYETADGRRCAVGRLVPDIAGELPNGAVGQHKVKSLIGPLVDRLGIPFLTALQHLHDADMSPDADFEDMANWAQQIDKNYCGGLLWKALGPVAL